jgi:hypothetical protein
VINSDFDANLAVTIFGSLQTLPTHYPHPKYDVCNVWSRTRTRHTKPGNKKTRKTSKNTGFIGFAAMSATEGWEAVRWGMICEVGYEVMC